jgi:predicted RNA methylase
LTLFAIRAGAKRVYAVEETAIADVAEEIMQRNNVGDSVVLVRANSLDAVLPEQGDLLMSELIGQDPLAEGLVFYLADAVRRFLRPGGRVIPASIEVMARGVEAPPLVEARRVADKNRAAALLLEEIYGFDLSPLVSLYDEELRQEVEEASYQSSQFSAAEIELTAEQSPP